MAANGNRRPTLTDLKVRGDRAIIASVAIIGELRQTVTLSATLRQQADSKERDQAGPEQTSQ